jgi:hypothetical protein
VMADQIAIVVLKALAEYVGRDVSGFGMDGVPPAQVAAALSELQRGGLINGLQVTDKGRKLLEELSK